MLRDCPSSYPEDFILPNSPANGMEILTVQAFDVSTTTNPNDGGQDALCYKQPNPIVDFRTELDTSGDQNHGLRSALVSRLDGNLGDKISFGSRLRLLSSLDLEPEAWNLIPINRWFRAWRWIDMRNWSLVADALMAFFTRCAKR